MPDQSPRAQLSRRQLLKRAGLVGAAAIATPIGTLVQSPTAAQAPAQAQTTIGRGQALETLTAALEQNSHEIDEDLRIARRCLDRGGVTQIGLHCVDLPHATQRLQMSGEFRPANRYPYAIVALRQSTNHVTAKKSRSAIDSDEGIVRAACAHAALDFRAEMPRNRQIQDRPRAVQSRKTRSLTSWKWLRIWSQRAQVAELVDALVSGTSGESRGGSSPLLGTNVPS